MHWFNYCLFATTLWAANWQNSVAETESSNATEATTLAPEPKKADTNESEIFFPPLVPEPTSTGLAENGTGELISANVTTAPEVSIKSGEKGDAENISFNDIKPFLLFPILPYLFPPREEENLNSGKDELSSPKNDTAKVDGNPADGKPFIFFDFAFNIRQIPINNGTEKLNDSKIINVKKLSVSSTDDTKTDSMKNRRRRNTKIETPGFFDDVPLFPDSELDEFLPKPDLFFPDLPFHHKPAKKLSRRKRDQKKTELKNNLKSFFDAFDEAFMRTKRELEWTDPILNFLRGGEPSFDEEKKDADDLFGQLPDMQEKPSVKWRIQRNIKRLNNDHPAGLTKAQESPTIIVDKVVKIGEFHVHDDGHDKGKKKRLLIDPKRKFLGRENHDEMNTSNDQDIPKSIFELIKQEGTKRKKRVHVKISNPEEEITKKTESREAKSTSQTTDSFHSTGVKRTAEPDKKRDIKDSQSVHANNTEKLYNLMKMFDTLKGKMEVQLKSGSLTDKKNEGSKTLVQEDLKRNLTELLKQFMALNKNLEEPKLVQKKLGERDDSKLFDWAEKDTLQNTNVLGKASRERRQKKDDDDDDDDDDDNDYNMKKERQIADLNHLLMNVTIPTILVFGVILVICFFGLQAKGKICASLFRPRQVLIVNDEAATYLKNSGSKKVQAI